MGHEGVRSRCVCGAPVEEEGIAAAGLDCRAAACALGPLWAGHLVRRQWEHCLSTLLRRRPETASQETQLTLLRADR